MWKYMTYAFLVTVCMLVGPVKSVEVTTIDTELVAARKFLEGKNTNDALYIKFFTTYAVPEYLRETVVLELSFWLHSMTGPTKDELGNHGYFAPLAQRIRTKDKDGKIIEVFTPIQQVPTSPTLWWVDIRDYNWKIQSFETVSKDEPFIKKPWLDAEIYDDIRQISGNAIVRADWFLAWTSDVTKQADRGREPYYYTLLYSHVGAPKTGDEYRKIWGIESKRPIGGAVDIHESIVALNNRELAGVKIENGYHYETSDFKTSDNDNDTIENLSIKRINGIPKHVGIARKADAHEYITSNELELQVYFLTDGKENRVEFGDPTVVRDGRNPEGDVRVKNGRSCVTCHPQGLNPPKEAIRDYLLNNVELKIGTKEYKQAFDSFYNYERLMATLQDNQIIYARAVVRTNGLLPEENARLFEQVLAWYESPLTIQQAALECGVTVEEFKKEVGKVTSGRLSRLIKDPKYKIARTFWENPINGGYMQAMLLIKGESALQPVVNQIVITVDFADVMVGKEKLGQIEKDTEIEYLSIVDGWFQVKYNGKVGYISNKQAKIMGD